MIHLQGRTALITGSSQGVGRAIAVAMARAGAAIVTHGLLPGDAEATAEACRETGAQAEAICGDLCSSDDTAAGELYAAAMAANPAIDTLVNNAGVYCDRPYLEMDFATYARTLQLNLQAPFFLTQRFARHWVAEGIGGRVLFTGSINGRLSEPAHCAYDASKGAVESLVRSLCVELAPRGIRVNGMAPGLVYTPLTAPALDDQRFRAWMELHTPNGKVPPPDVCGGAAVFLCSDQAEHVHGQMLLVDGGMSVWQQPDPPAG